MSLHAWGNGRLHSPVLSVLVALCLNLAGACPADAAGAALDPKLLQRLGASLSDLSDTADPFDAQVWLLATDARLRRYVKDPQRRERILTAVFAEAARQALNPDLVLAVMHVESYFDPTRSPESVHRASCR